MSKEIQPIVEELEGEWTSELGDLPTTARTTEEKLFMLKSKLNELIYWKDSI